MSPASLDEITARYAEIDALIDRAIAACRAKDRALAALDERLDDLGLLTS